jgi:hypothetical protein
VGDLLSLLKTQNRYLQKCLGLSQEFLSDLLKGEFSGIAEFEKKRGLLVRALKEADKKISAAIGNRTLDEVEGSGLGDKLRAELKSKRKTIEETLDIDTKIFAQIEASKDKLMQDALGSKKEKEAIGKFKSSWVPKRGEGIDQTL